MLIGSGGRVVVVILGTPPGVSAILRAAACLVREDVVVSEFAF